MKYLLLLVFLLTCGCATPLPLLPAKQSFVDIPPADEQGSVSVARVGDSVVKKAKIYERPAKFLSGEIVDKELFLLTYVLGPGKYQALYKSKDVTYYGPTPGVFTKPEISVLGEIGLVVYEDGRHYVGHFLGSIERNNTKFTQDQVALISDATYVDLELPSFKQEFIYNGIAGSVIRFMYREYKDDMARPAFTQNLVYDMSQSDRIVFRSLELEVVEATNSELRYLVISGFPNFE